MKLRDYQKEALHSIINLYNSNITKQLIVLPTGSGKTVIIAAILKFFNKKTLVISHRKEIIKQTINTIKRFCDTDVGIYLGKEKDLNHKIIVGSIQTCCISKELLKEQFDILIIDEAHHSAAKTYKKLIDELGFGDNSSKLLIGFTATPNLSNGNTLGNIYQEISYHKEISEMIDSKYLVNVICRKIRTDIDLKDVEVKRGDYKKVSLCKIINTFSRNKLIVEKYKEHIKCGKTLAFCVDIKHANDLDKVFKSYNIKSEVIIGKINKLERNRILKEFRQNKIEVLISVSLFIEGFDMPEIDSILMARPTKSRSLYIQMIGRGLRPSINKDKCMVLDFIDIDHTLHQSIRLDMILPDAEIESEIKEGDCSEVNINTDSINLSNYNLFIQEFTKVYDDKIDLLDKNKLINNKPLSISQQRVINRLKEGECCRPAPYGYKNIYSYIVIKKDEAEIVKFIYKNYLVENSIRDLCEKIYNDFGIRINKSSVSSILNNKFYYGIMDTKYGEYKHKYEPIISKKMWDEAHNKLAKSTKKRNNTKIDKSNSLMIYQKIIKCFECGCSICGYITKEKYVYYSCTLAKFKHQRNTLREEIISNQIIKILKNIKFTDLFKNKLKNKSKEFTYISENEFNSYIYKFKTDINEIFNEATIAEKQKIIKYFFKSLQLKNKEIIYELNPEFEISI